MNSVYVVFSRHEFAAEVFFVGSTAFAMKAAFVVPPLACVYKEWVVSSDYSVARVVVVHRYFRLPRL